MDVRLRNDAVYQVVGPSGCGKTMFVIQLLASNSFIKKPKKIYWLMGQSDGERGLTERNMKSLTNVEVLNGFVKGWINKPKSGDVIVIDDLFAESTKQQDFNNLFQK